MKRVLIILPALALAAELRAQPADLDVDRAVQAAEGPVAREVEELVARQHPRRPLDEGQQQVELAAGEVDHGAVRAQHLAAGRVTGDDRQAVGVRVGQQRLRLLLHGGDHLRMQVAGVQHGDAAGEVDVLAAVDVPHGGVLGALGDDRVDLADTARYGGSTALQQGFVGLAHNALIAPVWSGAFIRGWLGEPANSIR